MSEARRPARELLVERENEYLLARVRVKLRSQLENIEAGDFVVEEAAEGQTIEVPRWAAEEFVALNLADAPGEAFEAELYRALSREKMMGPLQLSPLPADFYVRMKRRIAELGKTTADGKAKNEDQERLRKACYDVVGLRLNKLLSLSSSTKLSDLGDKLTPDEASFFAHSQASAAEWRDALLGDGK